MLSNIYDFILSISNKEVLLFILVICVIIFMYYSFYYEGFSNKDNCKLSMKGSELSKKAMFDMENQTVLTSKDQINIGYRYRDMQSRDLILGDEKVHWCAKLTDEERKQVEEEISHVIGTEVVLFDGPGLIDALEKKSLDDGIEYAGADSLNQQYSKV